MGEVVELKFRSPRMQDDYMSFIACGHCRNKNFLLVEDGRDFPLMKCSACGQHMGRMGWVHDDDPLVGGSS